MSRAVTPKPIVVPDTPLPEKPRGFKPWREPDPARWAAYVRDWNPPAAQPRPDAELRAIAGMAAHPDWDDKQLTRRKGVPVAVVRRLRGEFLGEAP